VRNGKGAGVTVLSSSSTFTIGAASTLVVSAPITVLPVAAPGTGKGRLVHEILGTYDYAYAPDEWEGIDQDLIIEPVWANSRTLNGAANTLWQGAVGDVEVTERWISGASMPVAMLRMLLAMWVNPPDPASSYVTWYPQYTTSLAYSVILLGVSSGGGKLTLDMLTRQGWVAGTIEQRLRVVARA
jgi:hypothetical protein